MDPHLETLLQGESHALQTHRHKINTQSNSTVCHHNNTHMTFRLGETTDCEICYLISATEDEGVVFATNFDSKFVASEVRSVVNLKEDRVPCVSVTLLLLTLNSNNVYIKTFYAMVSVSSFGLRYVAMIRDDSS